VEPAGGVEEEALHEARGASAQLPGQRRQHLQPRGGHHRAQAELGSGSRQAGQEHGLGLVGGHAGEPRPVALHQPHAAMWAALGVDRYARLAERLDVAVDRPFRHLQLTRQLGGRHLAAGLEQEEQGHQAGRAHRVTR
jgi:hypothetical protein